MKKFLITCLVLSLLTSCSIFKRDEQTEENTAENTEEVTPTETPIEKISIAEVEFTQSQAEILMKRAVQIHCGNIPCTITGTQINGGDIYGQYTYEIASGEEDVEPQVVTVDVVLQGVTVNKNKPSIAYFGENLFSDDMNPETEDAPIEGQTDFPTIKRYDLPTEITNPGAQPPFVEVYNDGQVVIYQVNLALGYLWIEATVYDPGYAKFTLLDLQQKEVAKMIDENVTGVYQGTAEAEPGFYYLVTETSNVAFNWTTWR